MKISSNLRFVPLAALAAFVRSRMPFAQNQPLGSQPNAEVEAEDFRNDPQAFRTFLSMALTSGSMKQA